MSRGITHLANNVEWMDGNPHTHPAPTFGEIFFVQSGVPAVGLHVYDAGRTFPAAVLSQSEIAARDKIQRFPTRIPGMAPLRKPL